MTQRLSPSICSLLAFVLGTLCGCEAAHEAARNADGDPSSVKSDDGGGGAPGNAAEDSGAASPGGSGGAGASADDTPPAFTSDLPSGIRGLGFGSTSIVDRAAAGVADGPIRIVEAAPASAAERAQAAADIAQIAGDRLYTISPVAGLTVTDISRATQPRVLGTYRGLQGMPLRLYLRGGVAIVVFSSRERFERDADGRPRGVQMGQVVAFDVADPAAIRPLAGFDSPGVISDSHLKEDVLYLIGSQNGSCWRCEPGRTQVSVAALDIRNPQALVRLAELAYPAGGDPQLDPGFRPVLFTSQRIYLGAPVYGDEPPAFPSGLGRPSSAATIQVVDISAAGGQLVSGAQITLAGQLTSAWKMDEYQNVLRVVTQATQRSVFGTTQGGLPPSVQTFAVESSQQLRMLGHADLDNEGLEVVRFDGPRAYAITSNNEVLWTIDLAQPAQPRRAGVLRGARLFELEPHGDRLFALSFDPNATESALGAWLFDVSRLDAPQVLSNVSFGPSWATMRPDPERGRAFKLLADAGLLLVPFLGANEGPAGSCLGTQRSGVQLITFAGDVLALQGTVPSQGEPRRLIARGTQFWSVGHEAVHSFDLADPARPAALGAATLARNVSHVLPLANGFAARVNQSWYADTSSVDFVAVQELDDASRTVSELEIARMFDPAGGGCHPYLRVSAAFAVENRVDLIFTSNDGNNEGVLVLDASDPRRPQLVSRLDWGPSASWNDFYDHYNYGYAPARGAVAHTGRVLGRLEQRNNDAVEGGRDMRLRIVDLTDPAAPTQTLLELPPATGYGGLLADADAMLFTHVRRGAAEGRGSFYVDRVDLSDPRRPRLMGAVNTPGALLHRAGERALTSELIRSTVDGVSREACAQRFAYYESPYPARGLGQTAGGCAGYRQVLHLVRFAPAGAVIEDSLELGERERVSSASGAADALFAVLGRDHVSLGAPLALECSGIGIALGCTSEELITPDPAELLVLTGLNGGELLATRFRPESGGTPWPGLYASPSIYAVGDAALLVGLREAAVVDTRRPEVPALLRTAPLFGDALGAARAGEGASLALGAHGAQRIELRSQP